MGVHLSPTTSSLPRPWPPSLDKVLVHFAAIITADAGLDGINFCAEPKELSIELVNRAVRYLDPVPAPHAVLSLRWRLANPTISCAAFARIDSGGLGLDTSITELRLRTGLSVLSENWL